MPTSRLLPLALALCVIPSVSFADQKKKPSSKKNAGPSITWVNEAPAGKELPPRLAHKTFHSDAADRDVGYTIYLPPQYESEPDRLFPVIYNLHGNGGNEWHSFEDIALLHEQITAGKIPPIIMALPNGGKSTFYKDSFDGKFPIETLFIKEFIPHIDSTYRTIAARHGRCIEGFSMGGRGSTRLAVKYPDLFCSLFCQAGNVPRTSESFDPDSPNTHPNNYLGPNKQNYLDNDVFVLLERNIDKIKGHLRIQIACGTKDGGHLPTVRDFHNALVALDVDHTYIELEGLAHSRAKMIETLRPVWFDYHVESMRRASESEKSESSK